MKLESGSSHNKCTEITSTLTASTLSSMVPPLLLLRLTGFAENVEDIQTPLPGHLAHHPVQVPMPERMLRIANDAIDSFRNALRLQLHHHRAQFGSEAPARTKADEAVGELLCALGSTYLLVHRLTAAFKTLSRAVKFIPRSVVSAVGRVWGVRAIR